MTEDKKVWEPEEGADLISAVYQAVGSASMAWSETPTGVFDDVWASTVAKGLIAWINDHYLPVTETVEGCGCWSCVNDRADKIVDPVQRLAYLSRFIVCPDCGNKRCPKATHHANACSGSNISGQTGSRFGGLEWRVEET
jgi:hypothetical protein